jgi:uncharacterized protein (DUF927 family)
MRGCTCGELSSLPVFWWRKTWVLQVVIGSNLQSWSENRLGKERAKREVVQTLGDYRSKEPLDSQGPVQIQHVVKEGLVLNNNDADEFRIGNDGGAGCTLLGGFQCLV